MQHFTFIGRRVVTAFAVIALVGSGLALVPQRAHATTDDELRAEIAHLLAILQQLEAQLNGGGSSADCVFTHDLGYGMSGPDVTCLQNYLIHSGYSIPAGPTGSFYSQTQAAVAVWQAAHGVVPANGYFGATSRAEYTVLTNGDGGNGGNGGGDGGNGGLNGGQASFESFDLSDDNTTLHEDQSNKDVATVRFRPDGGDIRVQDLNLRFQASDSDLSVEPWQYFDSITIYDEDNNEKLDTMDVSSSGDWDRVNDNSDTPVYEIDFSHLDDVIRENDYAHLQIRVDTDSSIDSHNKGQSFDLFVPSHGLQGEDSTGKTRTTGDASDHVTVQFGN